MANIHIITFIQSLSEAETKVVDDYLQKIQPLFVDEKNKEAKEYQLFKFIISNKLKTITDGEILNAVPTKDLTHLKTNLYSKILEALTFDKYITNASLFNENTRLIFKLKKKLLVFRILFHTQNQKKTEAIDHLLNEIIDEAKSNEIYDILIEALTARKYFKAIRAGVDEFNNITTEIELYDYANKALYYATDSYYKLVMNRDFIKSLSEKELDKHLKISIKQMESDLRKTKSQQINYYLHILQFASAEQQKDYKKAIDYCVKLIAILKNNKVIYRQERMGLAYSNLSQYKSFIGKYKEARADAASAQKFYPEKSFNYLISKEQEFYIDFYDTDYQKAFMVVNELLGHSLADTGEFRKSKFIYYQACIFFANKQFKEALSALNKSMEIEKDKSRWNVALRIMNIQIYIELNKIDEASNALESLRKYMERTGKNEEIKERDELIVKFLREIEKSGFTYNPSNTNASKILKALSEKDKPASWEHYTPELIPFHEWVGKKTN